MSIFKKAISYLTGKKEELDQEKIKLETENKILKELFITQEEVREEKPCVNKLVYNVNNKTLQVISCSGDTYAGFNIEPEQLESFRNADNETIIALLTPKKEEIVNNCSVEEQEKELVSNFLDIFNGVDDFEVVNNSLYFKNIRSVAIPSLIVARFVEILEEMKSEFSREHTNIEQEYQSLKAFTYWLLLNPIESARKDALDFVRKNQIPITSNGMLVTFRKVVSKGKKNKDLVKFISENYFKVKKNKKSPKNYAVYCRLGDYKLFLNGEIPKDDNPCWINNGNLYELYHNLSQVEENIFTDSHTKSKTIKIGEVYKEDEDNVDLDNTKDCSSGLHSGSLSFGSFNSFGDTGVICLVNPMKIRSVPVSDCSKMRSSELFPVAIVDFNNYEDFVKTQEITELSEIYYNESIEFLQETLKNKEFDKFTCQNNLFEMNPKEILSVTEILKNRIVNI